MQPKIKYLSQPLHLGLYISLSLLTLVPVIFHSIDKDWVGDFWAHAAVMRELIQLHFRPREAGLNLAYLDAYYSPYLLLLSLGSTFLSISPIHLLSNIAIVNFILFAVVFYIFVTKFFVPRNYAALALFLVLFLWGSNAWWYSGFYHFEVIHLIAAYPSFFCQIVTLLALILFSSAEDKLGLGRLALLILLFVIVLLSHQLTFIFLLICHFSLALTSSNPKKSAVFLGFITCIAVSLACLWPYFSVLALLHAVPATFHSDTTKLYADVFSKTWPTIILVPLALTTALSTRPLNRLIYAPLILLAVYCYGWYSGKYILGRELGGLILILQLFIASSIAQALSKSGKILGSIRTLLVALGAISSLGALIEFTNRGPLNQDYKIYSELISQIPDDAVVITALGVARILPAFTGNVVASPNPTSFLSDQSKRVTDIENFFRPGTSLVSRQQIIRRYNVAYILSIKPIPIPNMTNEFNAIGKLSFENNAFVLIKVFKDS